MTVYLGIDWSEKSHSVVFIDESGKELCQRTIEHSQNGFSQLEELREQLGVEPSACIVGLETAHNLMIDWLWAHRYSQVYVVPPNVTRSRQRSYRQSGARTDRSDGYLIANLLRTDRHLLYPWCPDRELTQHLRATVRLRSHFVKQRVAQQNQLRQSIQRYYPTALTLFGLESYIALDFIQRYPTPLEAQALSYKEFEHFARTHRYPASRIASAYVKLKAPQPTASPAAVVAYQEEAVLRAQALTQLRRSISQVEKSIDTLFQQHPDAKIFASPPGVGPALAPALLVKFGDDRQRFPCANSVQALAGTAPVTDQSGQRRTVRFRRACDREFRTYAQLWAKQSLRSSPWAAGYFANAQERGLSFNHSCRALANRWLAVLWKCWQSGETYDPAIHMKHSRLFRRRQKR